MICVSILEKDVNKCLQMITGEELAEIRLDLTRFSFDAIKQVFSSHKGLIATCRQSDFTDNQRIQILEAAITSGAKYVDIEIESKPKYVEEISSIARKNNCDIIVSYHNYVNTPDYGKLKQIVDECYVLGADVAKVATMVNTKADVANLLAQYNNEGRKVIIGMGDLGKITRALALIMGAEFTFATPSEAQATAPGQITKGRILELINYVEKL